MEGPAAPLPGVEVKRRQSANRAVKRELSPKVNTQLRREDVRFF